MSMSSEDKLELLWKSFKQVTPTASSKASYNEALVSRSPLFQQSFWTDSDRIPMPAPSVDVPTGNELWFGIVEPYKQVNAVALAKDPTTPGTAWHAMDNISTGVVENNRLRNWVPPTLHRSYHITVWAGNPSVVIPSAERLSPVAEGFEWEFDYTTGVLFFPNGVPLVALELGIWIEGWRYIGSLGREGQADGAANTSKIREYSFIATVASNTSVNFDLPTGGKCILVEAKVNYECTLECHATSDRLDTNPYRFKSINTHLVDDGSYIVSGQRYYGERFVPLLNMEDTTSENTYWKLTNNEAGTRVITVIVKVA